MCCEVLGGMTQSKYIQVHVIPWGPWFDCNPVAVQGLDVSPFFQMISNTSPFQWIILVLVKDGRDDITPKRRQGLYLVYKRYFSCQLDDYILPIPAFTRTRIIH